MSQSIYCKPKLKINGVEVQFLESVFESTPQLVMQWIHINEIF